MTFAAAFACGFAVLGTRRSVQSMMSFGQNGCRLPLATRIKHNEHNIFGSRSHPCVDCINNFDQSLTRPKSLRHPIL